jgi:anion-transporting  ArsA/GET3 family ATPase
LKHADSASQPPPAPPLPDLLTRRFVLVTGKGGVGKTSVTAALGRLSAAAGRRTLICELNTHEHIPGLFGHAPVGGAVSQIAENLWSVNIQPDEAMEEYGVMKLRFKTLYRLVFDNPLVRRLVRFVPGVNDLLMLGKAFNHERERDHDGKPVWDTILVDAPATGHGIMFFKLPRIIRDAVPAGNLHREAADMWTLLTDPERTAVHLVTLPEELPVRETVELHGRLADELGLPLGALLVNMVPPTLLSAEQAATFARLETRPEDPLLGALWDSTKVRLSREALSERAVAELDPLHMFTVRLPLLYTDDFGATEIEILSQTIAAGLAHVAAPPVTSVAP